MSIPALLISRSLSQQRSSSTTAAVEGGGSSTSTPSVAAMSSLTDEIHALISKVVIERIMRREQAREHLRSSRVGLLPSQIK